MGGNNPEKFEELDRKLDQTLAGQLRLENHVVQEFNRKLDLSLHNQAELTNHLSVLQTAFQNHMRNLEPFLVQSKSDHDELIRMEERLKNLEASYNKYRDRNFRLVLAVIGAWLGMLTEGIVLFVQHTLTK